MNPVNPEFDRLKSIAHSIMSQKQLDAASLIALGGSLAADVNKLAGLSGLQKKQLVLDVIKSCLKESIEKAADLSGSPLSSAETVQSLNFVVDYALPASLDLAVAAARGHLDLKKVKASAVAGCFAGLPVLLGLCGASKAQIQVVESVAKKVAPAVVGLEPDISNPMLENQEKKEKKSSDTQTPPRKSSLAAGVVLREPEATQSSPLQTA
jgi:hypothetical protein